MYDYLQGCLELPVRHFRRDLWEHVGTGSLLEVGVGTGKNIRFHPANSRVTAVDVSRGMLARARLRATQTGSQLQLHVGDVHHLPYRDHSFDVAVATYVFFAVMDPITGLGEVRRVLRPGGRLLLLEHVVSESRWLRTLMRALDPLSARIWGAHINRDTVSNVRAAGFVGVRTTNLALDVIRRIEATAPG